MSARNIRREFRRSVGGAVLPVVESVESRRLFSFFHVVTGVPLQALGATPQNPFEAGDFSSVRSAHEQGAVGGKSGDNYYHFSTTAKVRMYALLTSTTTVRLSLLDGQGRQLAVSQHPDPTPETIAYPMGPGEYYLDVHCDDSVVTGYQLVLGSNPFRTLVPPSTPADPGNPQMIGHPLPDDSGMSPDPMDSESTRRSDRNCDQCRWNGTGEDSKWMAPDQVIVVSGKGSKEVARLVRHAVLWRGSWQEAEGGDFASVPV